MDARKGNSVNQAAAVSTRYVDASGVRYAYREGDVLTFASVGRLD